MAKFEYTSEVLKSIVGEEKLRMGDLEDALEKHGEEGWELVSLTLNVNIQRGQDGDLLIFKRAKG
jgi:hypothetical protein